MSSDLKGAVNVQFMRMQVGNEKEHQKSQKEQGKRQKEIKADFCSPACLCYSVPANLLKYAAKGRIVNSRLWLKAVGVHIPQ